jgi:hypothetical protein
MVSGAIFMEMSEKPETRRAWVAPELRAQSTLTVVTQVTSPVPLTLLFLQASTAQCFDGLGNPVPCP